MQLSGTQGNLLMYRYLGILALTALIVSAQGCGHKSDRAPLDPSLTKPAESTGDDRVADLRSEVHKRIEIGLRTVGEDKQRVQFRSPYWYKEYAEYPGGSDTFEVETVATQSRTAPMTATVTLDKIRYSTRLHRERSEAVNDENFLRDTGTERLSYEHQNGRWIFNGGTFVADKSEELVNGAWVAVEETVQRTVAAEEKPGWFGRTWSTITGR